MLLRKILNGPKAGIEGGATLPGWSGKTSLFTSALRITLKIWHQGR